MWAIFTARWVLGLIFFMAGWWKCFELTPKGHAERFFIEGFGETWIPHWLLWAVGTSIPVLELVAGLLVCLGLARVVAYATLGAILVTVTYGHLLREPLFEITEHIFPRLALLLFVFVAPRGNDVLSLDYLITYLRRRSGEDPATCPSEDVKRVLERTLGVPLFLEQAIVLAVGDVPPRNRAHP